MVKTGFCAAVALFATALASSAQVADSQSEIWFRQNGLFGVPVTKQAEAKPGTVIFFLPTGEVVWKLPREVVAPASIPFTVPTSEVDSALQVGVFANFVTMGAAAALKQSHTITIQQASFTGSGYDYNARENVILQPGTSVFQLLEQVEAQWDPSGSRSIPAYFIQAVYSTANLDVSGARNTFTGVSTGAGSASGSCTPVAAPTTPSGQSAGTTSNPKDATTPSGPSPSEPQAEASGSQANASAPVPTAGLTFCKGKGGHDTLKGNTSIPVAMSVCNLYYWNDDRSWNCRPLNPAIAKKISYFKQ